MFSLNCRGKLLAIEQPLVVGILNVNSDSFYPGSRMDQKDLLAEKIRQMVFEGADILDVGGQSTRPGSTRISMDQELDRVLPAIEMITKEFSDVTISIDTYHSGVARIAVENGASIVNDIGAGEMDELMLSTVAALGVPYICMHMKGTPETMQQQAVYDDVAREVLDFFIKKVGQCRVAGINDLIIDPGFGFGKTIAHNFALLKNLSVFKMLGLPVMAGLSRKSTIYKTLEIPVEEALNGTTVLNTIALLNGANLLRVHEVREAKEAIKLFTRYSKI